MKMNKLKDFTKKYGFYLAVGLVSVGAITAVVLTTETGTPEVAEVGAPAVEDVVTDQTEQGQTIVSGELVEEVHPSISEEDVATDAMDTESDQADVTESEDAATTDEEELVSETFSTTTADPSEAPFFAEGDTLGWPVDGAIMVEYTDDTTAHWESPALKETMRTYGICIESAEGTSIKAPAKGTIIDIVNESKNVETMKYAGNLGQVVMMDLGNGYTVNIAIQGGQVDKALLGQVVEQDQVIGTVGKSVGPYAGMSPSVYMQVTQNGTTVDPVTMLSYNEEVAEAVDMGHAAE